MSDTMDAIWKGVRQVERFRYHPEIWIVPPAEIPPEPDE